MSNKGGNRGRLPTVTSDIPKDLRYFIDRVGEMLTTAGLERFVTVRDLTGLNVINVDDNGDPTAPDEDDNTVDIEILKPPPFTAQVSDGYEYIYVDWSGAANGDEPGGYYYGHGLTEIWAGTTDNLEDAVLVQTVSGTAKVTSIYFGTGQTDIRIWGRFQNVLGVYGDFGGPYLASTAIDVPYVLDALEQRISNTQLAQDLYNVYANTVNRYVVNLQSGGVAAGFGLVSETDEFGEQFSQFAVLADNFAILAPVNFNQSTQPTGVDGDLWRRTTDGAYFIKEAGEWVSYDGVPFTVQTTPTTILYTDDDGNEQEVDVPPGVYIRSGFIQNATITKAMIQTASIDTARITDAAITSAKVRFLDAGKITSGIFQSDGFNNSPGFAGWYLNKGVNEAIDPVTGDIILEKVQEDVQFIIRSSEYDTPALELKNGNFTINGLAIREFIQSSGWPARGFQFDIDQDTYQFRDVQGRPIFTLDGSLDKDAIERSISDRITTLDTRITTYYQASAPTTETVGDLWVDTDDDNKLYRWNGTSWELARDSGIAQALNDAAQAFTAAGDAQTTADNKITTYFQTEAPSRFTVGLAAGDLWFDTNDNNKMYRWDGIFWLDTSDQRIAAIETTNEDLNQKLAGVLSPDGAGGFEINPSKVIVNYIDNTEVSLADYRFLQAFADQTQLDAFFDKAAFGDLIAGTLVARNAIVDTGTFGTVLTNEVAANNGDIDNLLVRTLRIDNFAVTVPTGVEINPNVDVSTSWVTLNPFNPMVVTWTDSSDQPFAFSFSAVAGFLGASLGGSSAGNRTMQIRFRFEFGGGNIVYKAEVGQTYASAAGGTMSTTGFLELGQRISPATIYVEARTDPLAGGGNTTRGCTFLGTNLVGAKR